MDPDRLLAVCIECGAWQYIEVSPDGNEAIMIPLPDAKFYWSFLNRSQDQAISGSPSAA
jgi:hypothetical protein